MANTNKEQDTFEYLEKTLKERIMFLDGAMGTMVQRLRLQESDFRGKVVVNFNKTYITTLIYFFRTRIFKLGKRFKRK